MPLHALRTVYLRRLLVYFFSNRRSRAKNFEIIQLNKRAEEFAIHAERVLRRFGVRYEIIYLHHVKKNSQCDKNKLLIQEP